MTELPGRMGCVSQELRERTVELRLDSWLYTRREQKKNLCFRAWGAGRV